MQIDIDKIGNLNIVSIQKKGESKISLLLIEDICKSKEECNMLLQYINDFENYCNVNGSLGVILGYTSDIGNFESGVYKNGIIMHWLDITNLRLIEKSWHRRKFCYVHRSLIKVFRPNSFFLEQSNAINLSDCLILKVYLEPRKVRKSVN